MRTAAAAFVLLFASTACLSQSGTREETLHKLEGAFQTATAFTAESPFLLDMLSNAKAANPGVPETTWQALRPEFAASITASLQNDGGATLRWLRVAFASLSDPELEHVAQIYSDPVFLKAQQSMASAPSQQESMRRNLVNAQLISRGINSVLRSHGLKEVH